MILAQKEKTYVLLRKMCIVITSGQLTINLVLNDTGNVHNLQMLKNKPKT